MSFYSNEDVLKDKKAIKNTVIKLTALLFVVVILNVALCLLVNKNNYIAIQVLNTCLSTFYVFTVIYKLDTVIISKTKKINHYKLIMDVPKTEFCGVVNEIGRVITVSSGLRVKEICLVANKKSYSFYLLENFEYDFNVGDNVKLTIAKKHIVDSFIIEKSEKGSYA